MNRPVGKVGLVLKRHDPRVPAIVSEIVPWLKSRGAEVFLDRESAREYPVMCHIVAPDEIVGRVDVVAVFGGDGTFLYAARLVAATGVPIIGINLGSLGFLTEVKVEEMQVAFDRVLSGEYTLEPRMLLEVEVMRGGESVAHYLALNDAVINKGALARIIEMEVTVNDDLVTLARADGLIISSPTGSTAYSLSAGGPILYPTLEAFLITPICPHTLTNRPVVVPENASVSICLRHGLDVMLTVDGQVGVPLEALDVLRVRKAAPVIRLVQATGTTFFRLLREKLKWS
jgi:NAD+ kinase